MAVVAGITFYVATNDPTVTAAAALLALVVFAGLPIYVGPWTSSQPSTASSSGVNGFLVLIFALAVASQVTHALDAPTVVPVGLLVVAGVVALVDQLLRRGEQRRVHGESASGFSENDKLRRISPGPLGCEVSDNTRGRA